MKKNILFWGVILITFLLISSIQIPAMQKTTQKQNLVNINNDCNENNHIVQSNKNEMLDVSSLIKNIFFRKTDSSSLMDFLTSTVRTKCAETEKTTEITFALFNDIDVDNNENTGINGKDIRIQYLILPYLLPSPDPTIGAQLSVNVERIGDEIKDQSFSLSTNIGENILTVGFNSSEEEHNEIPKSIQLSTTVFLQLTDSTIGFSFYMDPLYESNQEQKKITLFGSAEYGTVTHDYAFGFEPATETEITIRSTKKPEEWRYTLIRNSLYQTVLTARLSKKAIGETTQTKLTIDPLPDNIDFRLRLTPFSSEGGSLSYQCNQMYDMSVLVETNDLGVCKYALIENTPRRVDAEWIPTRDEGFYHIDIDSEGTNIYLLNTLKNPSINISLTDISTVDMTSFWNMTNPGDFRIIKDPSFHVNLDVLFDEWMARLDAEPTAENIYFSWKSNVSGYLTVDTNQDPLSNINVLIKGPDSGVNIDGETLSADDFHLDWTVWPLSELVINKSGSIDFLSLSIDIFVNNEWYHLWPWF